jgi:hypothetical protein
MNLRIILQPAPESPDSNRGPKTCFDQEVPFTGNSESFSVCVSPFVGTQPLRISLVWIDALGALNVNPALVNGLDLEVTDLSSQAVFKGNQFVNGFTTSDPTRDFDHLNNVECVYIQQPTESYQVRVIPAILRRNARPPFSGAFWQDFALVIDNAEVVPCP